VWKRLSFVQVALPVKFVLVSSIFSQDMLDAGHKSLQMTMRYAHLRPIQLHDDVARLNSTQIAFEEQPELAQNVTYINSAA
jgi:hypothetical protein